MMPDALPPAKQVPAAYVDLLLNAIGYQARPIAARRRPSTARAKRSA
jgi:hypothetical protein